MHIQSHPVHMQCTSNAHTIPRRMRNFVPRNLDLDFVISVGHLPCHIICRSHYFVCNSDHMICHSCYIACHILMCHILICCISSPRAAHGQGSVRRYPHHSARCLGGRVGVGGWGGWSIRAAARQLSDSMLCPPSGLLSIPPTLPLSSFIPP